MTLQRFSMLKLYRIVHLFIFALLLSLDITTAWTFQPPQRPLSSLKEKEFFKPELYISSSNVPLSDVRNLIPNTNALEGLSRRYRKNFLFHIDPRSATPTSIVGHIPLIPGKGKDNHVTLEHMGRTLGRQVSSVDSRSVSDLIVDFAHRHQDALNIDVAQLGPARAERVTDYLWQVHIPQQLNGVNVRHSRIAATINHGNLVMIGSEKWGNVHINTKPKIEADQAMEIGFQYVNGRMPEDQIISNPTLEIVPIAPLHLQKNDAFAGPIGQGYDHRLVWTFKFMRPPDVATWEVMIDAHTGEVIAFQDTNKYATQSIKGGVYPLTNTEACPSYDKCGVMEPDQPMPFADTGLPAPNNFTNSAGLFEYTSGIVTTILSGKYVDVYDYCGPINESAYGRINMGGSTGQHDCTSSGTSAGNTPASRSVFYEVNKLKEMARGYLPNNSPLQYGLMAYVNINSACNAYWNGWSINFFKSGGGCRNTGEIAGVFDHEWGHDLDYNDANGELSNPSESYADIVAMYRLQTSCMGYGFFEAYDLGCGVTADGTGHNTDLSQTGGSRCALNCSGVRETDWGQLTGPDHTPDTPANFVCSRCVVDNYYGDNGPCGREVHCESAVDTEAAWDFAARDLQIPPFNYDSNTAFIIANKIFYQGSGNIGNWHSCSCSTSSSDGCGSTNAYMQWLAADDDNGNINDGTPHMTALYNAFNRHAIACPTPTPTNSGCSGAPADAPTLTAAGANNQIGLSWTEVTGATKYWLFRTEGYAGCDFGKTLIATVTGDTTYTDTGLANGRQYCYSVMAVGSSDACFGPAGACVCAAPVQASHGTLQGTITDASTRSPISRASVIATGGYSTTANSSGYYQIADILIGTYDVTASAFGYQSQTVIGVVINDGATITQNLALNPAPVVTIQGTVKDDSGHGWPLYAKVDITAAGYSNAIYTDPATGNYSIGLYQDTPYTFKVSSSGYNATTRNITPPPGGSNENFALAVDALSCAAPGYKQINGIYEQFESDTTPAGWTVKDNIGTGAVWRFDNPCFRQNYTGGTGKFVIADSDCYNQHSMDAELITPIMDFTGVVSVPLEFETDFYYYYGVRAEVADVDVSNDDGATWTNVWRKTADYWGPKHETIDISSIAGNRSNIKVRFHYYNAWWEWWWEVDNVKVGNPTCVPVAGGLVVGNVYDANAGTALNNATVTDGEGHAATTMATPNDPGLDDGFYILFLPSGSHTLTASYSYWNDSKIIDVADNSVTRQDFNLPVFRYGTLQGSVRSSATGNLISGATVNVSGGFSTITDSSGFYQFASVPVGTHNITAWAYSYLSQTVIGVVINDGATITQNLALNPAPVVTIQGTVKDDSGHGWPLYAKIDITAAGYSNAIYTDPATGNYSIGLYQDTPYTFSVNVVSGYNAIYYPATRNITPPSGGSTENFAMIVNSFCFAPGYKIVNGIYEQFENSGTIPTGWTVRDNAGTGAVWSIRYDDWNHLRNLTGGSYQFAAAISSNVNVNMDTELITPSVNLTGIASVPLEFDTDFYYDSNEIADVDVSNDGGSTWTNVWRKTADYRGPSHEVIDISSIAGNRSDVKVRFHYYNAIDNWWWEIDNVKIGNPVCSLSAGGLVLGNVYDATTGIGLNNATVTDGAGHTAITTATPNDPGLDDGFYSLFLPEGSVNLIAAYSGYVNDSKTINVLAGSVQRQNFNLAVCSHSVLPINASFDASGGSGSIQVTAGNGCTWNTTNNLSWVMITSGSSGTGNGTVTYTVSANSSTSSRIGTLIIEGQIFTVTQAGVPHGTLQGTVTDATTGNLISGATVIASGGYSATTNSSGYYQITGMLTGTYDVTASAFGYQSQTVIGVVINDGITTIQNLGLNPLNILTSSLPEGTVGTSYNQTLVVAGGTSPYTWSVISGVLPSGLSLNGSTGMISGIPVHTDTFNFAVQVTDANSNTTAKAFSITVYCLISTMSWGYNVYGELGDGTTISHNTSVQISDLNSVTAIAGGYFHSIALKSDGTVWAWGRNNHGQLGDGTTTSRNTPSQVSDLNNVTAIARGFDHSIALKSDGSVWAWGFNYYGQLGDETTTDRYSPVQVSGLRDVIAVAGGYYHSMALKSDGTVWAWGRNIAGALGDGTYTDRHTPVQVSGLNGVIAIAGGDQYSMAMKSGGTVWAWGTNPYGQLGDGTTTIRYTPVQVSGLTGVTAIAGGRDHSIALKSDGTVWAWGYNGDGELGDGTYTNRHIPVQISGLNDGTAIAGGGQHSMALKSDGTVWAWGRNSYGQLGDGTTTWRNTPAQVSGLSGATAIAGGGLHSIALIPFKIWTTALPTAIIGASFNQILSATGGLAPYSWSVAVGSPPAGLNLNSATGEISGAPIETGTYSFTVQVTDANGNTASMSLSIEVIDPLVKIPGAAQPYYSLIQDAYNNSAADGDEIQCRASTFAENLNFDRNITITLKGGYDSGFMSNLSSTTINGSLTISNGTITVENIVIQ